MHLPWNYIIGFVVLAIFAAILLSLDKRSGGTYDSEPLLSGVKQLVFGKLRQAFPDHVVLAQVSLGQALSIKGSGKSRQILFNKISSKALDFVSCDTAFMIHAAIELDDRSHDNPVQRQRDKVKDDAFKSAGIPLLRWRAGKVPSVAEMRGLVETARA